MACGVCLDDMDMNEFQDERQATETCFKLECGHAFHTKCIVQFLKRSTLECPGCNKQKTPTEQVEYEAVVAKCMSEIKSDPRFRIAKKEFTETRDEYKAVLRKLHKEVNELAKKRAEELNIFKYKAYYFQTMANVRGQAKEIATEKGKRHLGAYQSLATITNGRRFGTRVVDACLFGKNFGWREWKLRHPRVYVMI
jgi:hypothetical protein